MASQDKALTPRQAAFVRWYTTPGPSLFNGTESSRKCGYKGSDNVLAQVASENLKKPHIIRAIDAALEVQFNHADVTVGKVLRDIEMTRQLAIRDGKYSAALRASDLHGKYLKMWIDKVEHVHTLEDVPLDDLVTLLGQLVGKVDGLDLDEILGTDGSAASGHAGSQGNPTTH